MSCVHGLGNNFERKTSVSGGDRRELTVINFENKGYGCQNLSALD